MKKYTVLDTEMVFDPYFAEAYHDIDPSCERIRIAARRIAIVSMFDFAIENTGQISVGSLRSYTCESRNEGEMIAAVFDDLRGCAERSVVTYGGSAVDAKVFELAAMTHDVSLPPQLRQQFGPRREHSTHLDLSLAMKGFGKTWHHLSEVMIRMGLPVALLGNKADPCFLENGINWKMGAEHCELDTLLTAMALVAWRKIQGDPCLRIPGASFALIEGYLRQRPNAVAGPILRREQSAILAQMIEAVGQAA